MIKERIIEEASKLFVKSGVKKITMGDLAKHLGISKRTIYEHFADKEELLIACISAHVENEDILRKVLAIADNMVEALLAMLQIDDSQASQRQYKLIEEIRKYYPQVYKGHLLRVSDEASNCFKQIISRGIEDGVFRKNLNPEIIVHFFNSKGMHYSQQDEYLSKFSLVEIYENIAVTYIRGMCTDEGLAIIDVVNNNNKLNLSK